MSSPVSSSDDDDDSYYGPSLPPVKPESRTSEIIGPVLPAQIQKCPDDDEDDDDSETIGPLPPGAARDPHANHQPVIRNLNQSDLPKRDEWMTVVPDKVEKKLGFKSVTSFSQRPVGPAVGPNEKTATEQKISKQDLQIVDVSVCL
jgi:hypothetical protein